MTITRFSFPTPIHFGAGAEVDGGREGEAGDRHDVWSILMPAMRAALASKVTVWLQP